MSNQTDAALKTSVLAALAWEPAVTAAHIGVTARDGVITLSGHVQRFAEKQAGQSAALRVTTPELLDLGRRAFAEA